MSATLAITIISALTSALRVVGQILGLRTRPSAQQRAEKAAHDARAASAQGDTSAVNAQVERNRIRRTLVIVMALGLLCSGCGCSLITPSTPPAPADLPPAVIVVSADRWQYPMTNAAGVVGWFVPAAVHTEYCEAVALIDYYRAEKSTQTIKGWKVPQ